MTANKANHTFIGEMKGHIKLKNKEEKEYLILLLKEGEEKIHVLVPKEHWNTLKPLVRKQVRVTIDDEL